MASESLTPQAKKWIVYVVTKDIFSERFKGIDIGWCPSSWSRNLSWHFGSSWDCCEKPLSKLLHLLPYYKKKCSPWTSLTLCSRWLDWSASCGILHYLLARQQRHCWYNFWLITWYQQGIQLALTSLVWTSRLRFKMLEQSIHPSHSITLGCAPLWGLHHKMQTLCQ